jgi:hypothetical protein
MPHGKGEKVSTHFEHDSRANSQRVADLKNQTADLERKLADARMSLDRELAQPGYSRSVTSHGHRHGQKAPRRPLAGSGYADDAGRGPAGYARSEPVYGYDRALAEQGQSAEDSHFAEDSAFDDNNPFADEGAFDNNSPFDYDSALAGDSAFAGASAFADLPLYAPDERTEVLVNHGRRTASRQRFSRPSKVAAGATIGAALVILLALILFRGGASWPPSVAVVQSEAARACQNPDVRSEPGQVNFACAQSTRQVLWAFALMTSADDPNFADARNGRVGLEPITPAQGGEVAWSLNLHHPYNPANPVDSLEVAARAINNIIGGATLTGANGAPAVQPGLEGNAASCLRYAGSAALQSRPGFPRLCAQPVTSPAGQAALVADVYQKWVVGAAPEAAQDAAVLFENAQNPGDPRVQSIIRQLLARRSSAWSAS